MSDELEAAASGVLPAWAVATPARRAHMGRVAALMDAWAERMGLAAAERARWCAAGWLHDALRDADPEDLRPRVAPAFAKLPGSFLHGPAVAARLAAEGIGDVELQEAIAYHTLGDPELGKLGRALIAADYLEPGRPADPVWRAALRARMPEEFDEVVLEVVRDKLRRGLERSHPLRPEMIALWKTCVDAT